MFGRVATFPEITLLYQQDPFQYSKEKAEEVAGTALQSEDADGHTYVYDGHLRRIAVMELLDRGKLEKGFLLPCLLGRHLPEDEEIAFSISCNAVNEFSVPLSPLALLMRCYDFDESVNKNRSKALSASDVAKKLVSYSSSDMVTKTVKSKMAETRRQYLSVSRRLSPETTTHLRMLLSTDKDGLERAFDISNLKSIPKNLLPSSQLSLVKRMVKAFETSLPTRKAFSALEVTNQVTQIKRAAKEIEKFLGLCNFEKILSELERFVDTMMNTQQFDVKIAANANLDKILPPLGDACKNLVPGGTNRISLSEKEDSEHQKPSSFGEKSQKNACDAATKLQAQNESLTHDVSESTALETEISQSSDLKPESETENRIQNEHVNDAVSALCDLDKITTLFGSYVHVQNLSPYQFSSESEYWTKVEGRADFVVMSLPVTLTEYESIEKLVRHIGMSMRETGVAHVFCSFV